MDVIPDTQFSPEKIAALHALAQEMLKQAFTNPGTGQLIGVNFCFADEHGNRVEIGLGDIKGEEDSGEDGECPNCGADGICGCL